MSIQALSDEVTLNILSHLGVQSLGRYCLVSREANRLACDDQLWKGLIGNVTIPVKGVKAFIAAHTVTSKEEALQNLKRFTQQISLRDSGQFTCYFLHNPDCRITAKLERMDAVRKFQEFVIFTRVLIEDKMLHPSSQFSTEVIRTFSCETILPGGREENDQLAGSIVFTLKDRIDTIKAGHHNYVRCANHMKIVLLVGVMAIFFHVFKIV